MHRLRRLHDSQYIMKNPFTNENSNLSNIFHNKIHRKKVESLKVRSTEEFLCQFAWLPCRFFRGRRQGRQPLNILIKNHVLQKSARIFLGREATTGQNKKNIKHKNRNNVQFKKKTIKSKTRIANNPK